MDTDTVPFETTLRVRDSCLCLHAQRAARAIARRFDEAFRPLGLTSGQYSLLMSMNRPKPPTMREVAGVLAMDRTTLTAALKPLERRGLLRVSPDPKDKRGRRLSLTEAGLDLVEQAVPVWRATHDAVDQMLRSGSADALRRDLLALTFGDT